MSYRVAVCGAMGRMGRESVRAIAAASDLELGPLIDLREALLDGRAVETDLAAALERDRPDVCIDFTHPEVAVGNALTCLGRGVAAVVGTSGVGAPELAELDKACRDTGVPALVVPNFAIGAVLMMRFAEEAARWMPGASIVEMHHPGKADAPSGTAMHTAERISRARAGRAEPEAPSRTIKAAGAMGASVDGVPVHSIRLAGLVAHQMVLFGAPGESLTLRHDSLDRSSFMPGVVLAARRVKSLAGLHVGLEELMFAAPSR